MHKRKPCRSLKKLHGQWNKLNIFFLSFINFTICFECKQRFSLMNFKGTSKGKRDGVIGHISKRENVNWTEKLHYCAMEQFAIHRDWVSLV